MAMREILRAEKIARRYGEAVALSDASFALRAGEIHALMGENGAGKSTLSKIIAGAVAADSGSILIDGQPVAIQSPRDAQACGISIIYQELDLFPHCTVSENIVLGNLHFKEGAFVDAGRMDAFCRPFVDQVGLRCDLRRPIASLSIGERQLVAIARALSMQARILLMDEPTSSLGEDAREQLFNLALRLKAGGTSIVYVSHKMDEIFRLCDRITILRDGVTIGTRDIASSSRDELIRMIVGRDVAAAKRSVSHAMQQVALSVQQLTTRALEDISFELHRGEVLGIAGLVGAGRSSLGAALAGLDRIVSGTITLKGKRFVPRSVRESAQCGLALLPEDRKTDGLMMHMSVLENAAIASMAAGAGLHVAGGMVTAGFVVPRHERAAVMPVLEALRLKCRSVSDAVGSLSGGNQQKALLARSLVLNPEVLFLDDPARGIDVGAKQDIYGMVEQLAASGKSILFVSSELPELLRCCDRILVLREGRLTGIVRATEATQESIMALATADV